MARLRFALAGMALCTLLGMGVPATAGKVVDEDSSVSFTPPPYFQTSKLTTGGPFRFSLVPPDRSVTISTGGEFDRKLRNAAPFTPDQAKAFCGRAGAAAKGLTLKQSNRFVLDSQNGVECQFAGSNGRTVHWIAAPVPAQLVLVMADWPKPPTKEQVAAFRQFLGGVQIF